MSDQIMRLKHWLFGHPRSMLRTVRVEYPRTSHFYTTTLSWDYKTVCACGKILGMNDKIAAQRGEVEK